MKDLSNVWNNVKEIDLRPLTDQAQFGVKIVIVGKPALNGDALAEQMRRDPARPEVVLHTPVLVTGLESASSDAATSAALSAADLVILLLDVADVDDQQERSLAQVWVDQGKPVLVLIHHTDPWNSGDVAPLGLGHWVSWKNRRVIVGPAHDQDFLIRVFAPAVIRLLPDQLLALGRYFPFFRMPIARQLINDSCLANSTYSLTTGIAEVVPVFDIPLNIADMFVLSKAQAFLVYKLGLVLGLSTRWQDYLTEFSGVLGSGFLWRQVARQLIGLIPAWGIIPKVAIAYAGTYVVGNVVLQWYLTGRHISGQQMRQLYAQAFTRGKSLASRLIKNRKAPRLGRSKTKALPEPSAVRTCSQCSGLNSQEARFCQHCGQAFES